MIHAKDQKRVELIKMKRSNFLHCAAVEVQCMCYELTSTLFEVISKVRNNSAQDITGKSATHSLSDLLDSIFWLQLFENSNVASQL